MTIKTIFWTKVAFLLSLFSQSLLAQDCSSAVELNQVSHFVASLNGYGQQLEFFGNARTDKNYIESEHNTIWYKFMVQNDCELEFDIIPLNSNDDYDFMLFKIEDDKNFCQEIVSKKNLPLRSNISRNNYQSQGKTGLKAGEKQTHHAEGTGSNFSKPVSVKEGESFVLVVDNVSGKGGHRLEVKNCILEKQAQKIVIQPAVVVEKPVYQDKYLEKEIAKEGSFNHFDDNLQKGEVVVLDAVIFFGNSSIAMNVSKPQLDELAEFMKNNPQSTIVVHGHTNGRAPNTYFYPKNFKTNLFADNDLQAYDPNNSVPFRGSAEKLSLFRARTVKAYLMLKGIEEKRIETKGWGDTKMKTGIMDPDSHLNRRVEIEIVSK
jgi:outer membrane protein OmpA-like peptidoglycan-associated protein